MNATVYVYAHWEGLAKPALVGMLRSDPIRGKEHFSFTYDESWLQSDSVHQIDPDLALYPGEQHSQNDDKFRTFLDSCPDRWGRLLMKRREALIAERDARRPRVLAEIDYLLGVHDLHRMGGLRFKREPDGPFLDNDDQFAAPPMSSLNELAFAADRIEDNNSVTDRNYLKWLSVLMAPGSSLGGARPKASVSDEANELWTAKFPSRFDDHDVGAWEYVVHRLAAAAGIAVPACALRRFAGNHHTFLSKRFDRIGNRRLHFTSAMTQLGYHDGDYDASYLELAHFLTKKGAQTKDDLAQLFRRVVFNISVSNTDDHLRNHGFILSDRGWLLSPAHDINPVTPAQGLHLNISDNDNRLDYELAREVSGFFQLKPSQANGIILDVKSAVFQWRSVASECGLSRGEIAVMADAFNV